LQNSFKYLGTWLADVPPNKRKNREYENIEERNCNLFKL